MHLSDNVLRRVKLQDLRIFLTVVEAGSMGKAAERLNTVQPAISRSIAELEHTLGVRLFDRHRQGIAPTEYGRALLDCGTAVFDDLRQGLRRIEFLSDPAVGEVRIGSVIPLAAGFVAAVTDRLAQRYPRIVFHILAAPVETLHRELTERNVDVLITPRLGLFGNEQFSFEPLYEERNVVVTGAHSPWVRRRKITLVDLMNESWTLPSPESVIGRVYVQAFRASRLDYPRATVFAISPEVRISLLMTGRYLTVFPFSLLKFPTRRPELKVLPIQFPLAGVLIGIITLKGRTISPMSQLFIKTAREIAKPLAKKAS